MSVTYQYIKDFFEKKERKSPFVLKTRYGKSLGSKFVINEKKASEWLAQRKRQQS